MNNAKISVVVPAYNIGGYLEGSVSSILDQSHSNLEIILVDDGSDDGTGRSADELLETDGRVIVVHKKNGGVTGARTDGIRAVTGDWIAFVDGDDCLEEDMFEILLDNALAHQADISHCGYQMVFPSRVDFYYNTKKKVVQDHRQGLYDLLSGDFVEPGLWNKLIRADIVKSTVEKGLIDASIRINEDLLMNYYFFKASLRSVYYDICPYHYVLRKDSAATSAVSRHKLYDPVRVQKIILEDVGDDKTLSDIVYGRLIMFYINGASMKNDGKEKYVAEYRQMCRSELKKLKPRMQNAGYGRSARLKYRLCVFSPALYRWIHTVYAKVKGTDNKYEVR